MRLNFFSFQWVFLFPKLYENEIRIEKKTQTPKWTIKMVSKYWDQPKPFCNNSSTIKFVFLLFGMHTTCIYDWLIYIGFFFRKFFSLAHQISIYLYHHTFSFFCLFMDAKFTFYIYYFTTFCNIWLIYVFFFLCVFILNPC